MIRGLRPYCQRAYLLAEMISVLPLIVAVSGLATAGILAALKTQQDSAALVARDQAVNTLLDALRADTRAATAARLSPDDDVATVELDSPGGRARYRFDDQQVIREVIDAAPGQRASQTWRFKHVVISAELDNDPAREMSLLTVRIQRSGQAKLRLDPLRCLETTFAVGRGYRS